MPLLLLGIATIVFIVSRLTPADPLGSIVGERNMNNPEVVAAAEERWGLDEASPCSTSSTCGTCCTATWARRSARSSRSRRDLRDRLPATLELTVHGDVHRRSSASGWASWRRATSNTVRRPRRPVLRARRLVVAGVLGRAAGAVRAVVAARLAARPRAPAPAGHAARRDHRLLHRSTRCCRATWRPSVAAPAPPHPAGLRAGLGRRRHRVAAGARQPARRVLVEYVAWRRAMGLARARWRTRTRCATRCCPRSRSSRSRSPSC